jgi:hypothetical protein
MAEEKSSSLDEKLKPLKPMQWSEYLIGTSHDRIE